MKGRSRKDAFTLIELAMASFLVGVALVSIVALLGAGNRAATEAEGAIRASLFARDAFATLRILNDRAASDPNNIDAWYEFWSDCQDGVAITQTTSFASGVWVGDSTGDFPSLILDGNVHTNHWCPVGTYVGGDESQLVPADFSLRYRFIVRSNAQEDDGEDAYRDGQRVPGTYYTVGLHVWNGISLTQDAEFSYFAIFSNPGTMRRALNASDPSDALSPPYPEP